MTESKQENLDNTNPQYTSEDFGLNDKPAHPIGEIIRDGYLGGRTTVYSEIKKGRLKVVKRGKSTLVLTPDLVAYLNALRGGANV